MVGRLDGGVPREEAAWRHTSGGSSGTKHKGRCSASRGFFARFVLDVAHRCPAQPPVVVSPALLGCPVHINHVLLTWKLMREASGHTLQHISGRVLRAAAWRPERVACGRQRRRGLPAVDARRRRAGLRRICVRRPLAGRNATPRRQYRDITATLPRHCRDNIATLSRHDRDIIATLPRHYRDITATSRDIRATCRALLRYREFP